MDTYENDGGAGKADSGGRVDGRGGYVERAGNWLTEYAIGLTSLDMGWLSAQMWQLPDGVDGEVHEPGADGNPTPTTFKKRILRKISEITDKFYEEKPDGE